MHEEIGFGMFCGWVCNLSLAGLCALKFGHSQVESSFWRYWERAACEQLGLFVNCLEFCCKVARCFKYLYYAALPLPGKLAFTANSVLLNTKEN